VDRGISCPHRNPQVAFVSPTYKQGKLIIWGYIKDFVRNIPGVKVNASELTITIPRPHLEDEVRIFIFSGDNPDSMRGLYLDFVVLDEYADLSGDLFDTVIMPLLNDVVDVKQADGTMKSMKRNGGALIISTPKSKNAFWKIYRKAVKLMKAGEDWFAVKLPNSVTKILDDETVRTMKLSMSEGSFLQEIECDFGAANTGSYYTKYLNELQSNGRVCKFNIDLNIPVYTAWDLGISDSTAIVFWQFVGREIHFIDYVEDNGRGLEYYANIIKSKPYIYEEHYLPHDGMARELGTGTTRQETLLTMGIRTQIIPKQSIADGINAVRTLLCKAVWFHKGNTEELFDALKEYKRKYDKNKGIFLDKPDHDEFSHAADAVRYMAIACDNANPSNRMSIEDVERVRHESSKSSYHPFRY
jgi:hypothetical protein